MFVELDVGWGNGLLQDLVDFLGEVVVLGGRILAVKGVRDELP